MNNQDSKASSQETTAAIGTWRVTYAPGPWVALVGPDALVVMPPAPARADRFLTALWESIVPTASVDDLVAELGRAGVTEMPDMVALFWDQGSMHSLVRGRLQVLDASTGEVIATGEGVRTWSETGLRDVRSVVIAAADETPAGSDVVHLPLVVGAATVGSLLVETTADRLLSYPGAAPRAVVESIDSSEGSGDEIGRAEQRPEPESDRADALAGSGLASAALAGGAVEAVAQGGVDAPHGQVYDPMHPESDEPPTAEIAAVPEPWEEDRGAWDDQPVEEPPVEEPLVEEPLVEDRARSWAEHSDSAPQASPGWAGPTSEPSGPGPDAATELFEAPVETEVAEETDRPDETERAAEAPGAAETYGPSGTAVLAGTAGPAGAARISGPGAVGAGEGPVEPPPVTALLRPITGAPVSVDRPVLIGRAPNAAKAGGNVTPRLMTVPSPSHDISRTHVKVEPVGRTVQATDLHSTNGTVLITGPIGGDPSLAGQRHQLVPGEPVAVQPGWILDLGDGVTILIDRA